MVDAHLEFVWLSLRRLGVPEADVDDVTQRVFLRASQRLAEIPVGDERAFLFRTAFGMASNARRTVSRRREVDLEAAPLGGPRDGVLAPDELVDLRRSRDVADEILASMPIELSAVLVLFEAEEMSMAQIAELWGIPIGTVASRLRRARAEAQSLLKRYYARRDFGGAKR